MRMLMTPALRRALAELRAAEAALCRAETEKMAGSSVGAASRQSVGPREEEKALRRDIKATGGGGRQVFCPEFDGE